LITNRASWPTVGILAMVADEERRLISKRTKEALDWLPIRLQGERKLDKARQDRAQNPKPKTRWLGYRPAGPARMIGQGIGQGS